MLEMIVTNPKIIIDHLMYNIYHFPIVFINQTVFENLLRPFIGKYAKLIMALLFVLVIISVLKYKLLNGEEIFCLTLSFLVTFAMVLAKVKSGYFSFFFIILVYYSLKIIKKNRVIGFLSLALIVPNPTNSISFHKKDLHRQIIYDIPQAIKFVNNFDRILTKNNCEKILIYDQLKRRMIELLSENDSRFFSTIFSLPPFKKPIELPRCIYIGDVAYTNLKYPSYSTNSNIRFKIHLLPVISKVPKEDIHSFQDGKFYFIKKIASVERRLV